ncbi:MAG: 4-hydroxy-3-methylbut-2-enyl diphosphate reductase [Calditerrivibrio sp.]|nr:4-hydroxy-3-methylbut-2-enyl diphosphate reductase [Calditerrivibrio sp.]MCA1932273.1 4-hydroxy-3-methylbut-2-enyl diphosphate reductase [Calditerrivibrio sp.]
MEILVAQHAGFCFGVERAVKIVKNAAEESEHIYTLGPIIHNPQLVNELKNKGVEVADSTDGIGDGSVVVLRSHGVEKDERNILENKNVKIIDAICPYVNKAHTEAVNLSNEGYFVVIFGEKDHPEVKGIASYIEGKFETISFPEEAELMTFKEKIGLVAQTTQEKAIFEKIGNILRGKCNDLKIVNTICNATTLRQNAAKKVAADVEIMFVVGGKNSANTRRLYKICKDICSNTFHIETKEEIDKNLLIGVNRVGVTAGASTPKNIIDDVIEYLNGVNNE